jgi:hypothetical protein
MGFGSAKNDATCDLCPSGAISRGGFRAQCVDCDGWSWPNDYSSECREFEDIDMYLDMNL